jgi:putative glutamine amidotransferase
MEPSGCSADHWEMRPLIGVFTSERHAGKLASLQRVDETAPAFELRLGMPYLRAVEAAGGLPVVLAPEDPALAEELLDRLDGLCLAGGPDLDPLAYGDAARHARLGPTDADVDTAELALARAADRRGMPLLGICRGVQAINVARGGTLHQHVDDHRQTAAANESAHAVEVVAGTRLAALTGCAQLDVNSFHHQAVQLLGEGLRVGATACDGTVEAVEDPAHPFLLGVQWHAEGMIDRPEQLALFAALVDAASAPRLSLAA